MDQPLFSRLITAFLLFFPFVHAFSAEENFLLLQNATDAVVFELGPHIDERLPPACSFNIALSLMGYDAGILKDEKSPVWDFQEGYDDYLESWKTPQTPLSWMTCSAVWYSKILAVQLGLENIQSYLALFEYGNQDISGGLAKPGPANSAWLNSSLKISAKEQVHFIQKMVGGTLPISANAVDMTKALLFKEELAEGWKLFGKTGMGSIRDEEGKNLNFRWFVGWIERECLFFPFAYNIREKEINFGQTIPRVKQLLTQVARGI